MSLMWSAFTVCGGSVCLVKRENKRSKCYFQLVTATSPKVFFLLLIVPTAPRFQSAIKKNK